MNNSTSSLGAVVFVLFCVAAAIFGLVGQVMNVIDLVTRHATMEVMEVVIRIAGLFIAPVGILMGWFF